MQLDNIKGITFQTAYVKNKQTKTVFSSKKEGSKKIQQQELFEVHFFANRMSAY